VALGGDDHGGDGALEPGEVLPEELARRGVGGAGDLAVERSIEEERLSEHLGDREDELDVGDVGEDLAHHALRPQECAFLGAGHSPLALHENGTIRSVFEEQSGFVHASLRKPKCASPQRTKASMRSRTLPWRGPRSLANRSSHTRRRSSRASFTMSLRSLEAARGL
jgi:hypothetical protein